MSGLLDQYLRGDCEGAWRAARALDLGDADARAQAQAVAREFARRARDNLGALCDHLERAGFQFHQPPMDVADPADDLPGAFEAATGCVLPVAVRAFYEVVHAVDLRGAHPDWDMDMADALVLYPLPDPSDDHWDEERAALETDWAQFDDDYDYTAERPADAAEPRVLTLAPDAYHKDGVSGSAPYAVLLAQPGAVTFDPTVEGFLSADGKRATFADYVRLCLRSGGFPGLDGAGLPLAALIAGLDPL